MKRGTWTAAAVTGALLAASATAAVPGASGFATPAPAAPAAAPAQPNVVLILTDDQDRSLNRFMPQTRKRVRQQGMAFSSYVVNTSLCCVARASLLRGQYAQNTHVENNTPPEGGFLRYHEQGLDANDLPVWLDELGYTTSMLGKYLNGYPSVAAGPFEGQGVGRLDIPAGWDDWFSPVQGTPYSEYNYVMNDNGVERAYGSKRRDYLTDVLADRAVEFLDQQATGEAPFFLYLAPYAPHSPYKPPKRYKHLLDRTNLKVPRTADFDEKSLADKPRPLSRLPRLSGKDKRRLDRIYRKRAASVRGVDDMVAEVLTALEANAQLDNTYVFVTSDNGYHLGQHRMPPGKYTPYESDIRLPLFVRGPGVPAGASSAELTSNIDLAPTIVDLAGGQAPAFVDGVSFAPWLDATPPGRPVRSSLLLERRISTFTGGPLDASRMNLEEPRDPRLGQLDFHATAYRGVRSADGYTYVLYADGQEELYDLSSDPLQLRNILAPGRTLSVPRNQRVQELRRELDQLTGCSGASCHQ